MSVLASTYGDHRMWTMTQLASPVRKAARRAHDRNERRWCSISSIEHVSSKLRAEYG